MVRVPNWRHRSYPHQDLRAVQETISQMQKTQVESGGERDAWS
jgi:hypothetical protein